MIIHLQHSIRNTSIIQLYCHLLRRKINVVQNDQIHVLLEPSADGIDTKELFIILNYGQRTVKDVIDLGDKKFAVLKFPLPKEADYIFFQPDDKSRFVRMEGAFADTYPILPGDQLFQIMTSYLVPYIGARTYTYTAPLNVARMYFVLPGDANISLSADGLTGPETSTLRMAKPIIWSTLMGA